MKGLTRNVVLLFLVWLVPLWGWGQAGPDFTICKGECVTIGDPAKSSTAYCAPNAQPFVWTIVSGDINSLDCMNCARPKACPKQTTTYKLNGGDECVVYVKAIEFYHNANVITFANIGRWGVDGNFNNTCDGAAPCPGVTGYNDLAAMTVKNLQAPANNFIDIDDDNFKIRIEDKSANENAGVAENIIATIGTITDYSVAGVVDDDMTEIVLTETGVNTGIFESKTQLLVTKNIVNSPPVATQQDDGFKVHSGYAAATMGVAAGTIDDDARGDRTHQTTIDGAVVVEYNSCKDTIPVSRRDDPATAGVNEDERRIVDIRVRVFNEPVNPGAPLGFVDISNDGVQNTVLGTTGQAATHVLAQIERANVSWAQAKIKVNLIGDILFVNAPNNLAGNSIILDGAFTLGPAAGVDERILLDTYAPGATLDVIEVFFVGDLGSNAVTRGPYDINLHTPAAVPAFAEKTFMYFKHNLEVKNRTMAHELGHSLDNDGDFTRPVHIFYPRTNPVFDDNVTDRRRLEQSVMNNCRLLRPLGVFQPPAGFGNRILRTY